MSPGRLRCAIYTRKSTEEGLDQDFNSLDAQRASGEAFILSQAGEGWTAAKTRYDDGAYSGATMDRPALQRLLADIEARKVDAVVVYKVDRLTRSLADFAKMVEVFDAHGVSFVSVTQQFNTTSSMGRLTLNVLLSFAQFEREVTGERIRDKIAASKKKGMWMGGVVPLGYSVLDRRLNVDEAEAETVRTLFGLYLKHRNVRLVKEEADRLGLRTKSRKPNNGRRLGREPFTRGHIYKLLSNPVYVGEIAHKSVRYPGQHEAIIDQETWDVVQNQLKHNAVTRRLRTNVKAPSLLTGLLFDEDGNPMVPSHANKGERRYRYYVSKAQEGEARAAWRLPAPAIEDAVLDGISALLQDPLRLNRLFYPSGGSPTRSQKTVVSASRLQGHLLDTEAEGRRALLLDHINRVEVGQTTMRIIFRGERLLNALGDGRKRKADPQSNGDLTLVLPVTFKRRGVEMKLVLTGAHQSVSPPDPKLVTTIARGHEWFAELKCGGASSVLELAKRDEVDPGDASRIIQLAFLAPDIVEAILSGRQPATLTAVRLKRIGDLPLSWHEQRRILGFTS